jgi:hypothetical protein
LGQSGALEQVEAERQEGSASSVGEKAEVAEAHEAAREQVEEEAARRNVRSWSTDRDVRPAPRCGNG